MKRICDRTDNYDYMQIIRCQDTGNPVNIYSYDIEIEAIWESMTDLERSKLKRYRELCKIDLLTMDKKTQNEFCWIGNWVHDNGISLANIPEGE